MSIEIAMPPPLEPGIPGDHLQGMALVHGNVFAVEVGDGSKVFATVACYNRESGFVRIATLEIANGCLDGVAASLRDGGGTRDGEQAE
jgi:hypothetical protein